MQVSTNIEYPDNIGINDSLRDAIVELVEYIRYGDGRSPKEAQFNFEHRGSISDRELYSISDHTETPAFVKVACSDYGRDANLVEANDRELFPPNFRQHVIPVYDTILDGYGVIQLDPDHNRSPGDGDLAMDLLREINQNTTTPSLNINLSDVNWYENRPVLQHWGELRR